MLKSVISQILKSNKYLAIGNDLILKTGKQKARIDIPTSFRLTKVPFRKWEAGIALNPVRRRSATARDPAPRLDGSALSRHAVTSAQRTRVGPDESDLTELPQPTPFHTPGTTAPNPTKGPAVGDSTGENDPGPLTGEFQGGKGRACMCLGGGGDT